jgi:hypothetical protein
MGDDTSESTPLTPESPREEGVKVPSPPIEDVEGIHLLDNEVRARLEAQGFTDDEILRWVEAYFAQDHEGDAEGLLAFIRDQERPAGEAQ